MKPMRVSKPESFSIGVVGLIGTFICTSITFGQEAIESDSGTLIRSMTASGEVAEVVLPREQAEIGRKNEANLAEKGFVEMLDEPPRAQYTMDRMNDRRKAAMANGRGNDPIELGFYDLSNGRTVDFSSLHFRPTIVNSKYLTENSMSYLLSGHPTFTQLHTNSQFGTIMIDEMVNTTSSGGNPNIEVAGVPATFYHVKYEGEKWATIVELQHRSNYFVIECDRKLIGKDKQDFIEMADDIVTSSVN